MTYRQGTTLFAVINYNSEATGLRAERTFFYTVYKVWPAGTSHLKLVVWRLSGLSIPNLSKRIVGSR